MGGEFIASHPAIVSCQIQPEYSAGTHHSRPCFAVFINPYRHRYAMLPFMTAPNDSLIEVDDQIIDLRNRPLAALLAWLVPGAGHFYQGRRAKAAIYFASIVLIWVLGFSLGGYHVVYASWQSGDKRWHYFLQAGMGAAALPAIAQSNHMAKHTDPRTGWTRDDYEPRWGGFMAPPRRPVFDEATDEISAWYARYGAGYEMGTWFTMIAGLLNILVIYDAYSGPLGIPISGRRREEQSAEKSAATGEARDGPGAAA
jgi:hypothetical protein